MLVSTFLNQIGGTKRLANIGMEALLILVIASGRLCAVSVARGCAVAVAVGTLWGFATFSNSAYTDRLIGGWGDPNNAGMCLLVLGCVALAYARTRRGRIVVAVTAVAGLIGTFSRTSLFALAIVVVWVVAAGRIATWLRAAAVAAVIWYVTTIPESEYTSGVFAGREGSDALRQRIDQATSATVNQHPFYGNGAGTAVANVQGQTFFFHNSYQSLRAEGGWILLVIVMLLFALILLALARLPKEYNNHWIEASLLGALVCAVNLGEVFLALPVVVAVGIALRHLSISHQRIRSAANLGAYRPRHGDSNSQSSDSSPRHLLPLGSSERLFHSPPDPVPVKLGRA